jgi:hypothetical protein
MVELSELKEIVKDRDRLAERWGQLPSHLSYYSDQLRIRAPKKASSLIVLPYSQPQSRPDWAKIIAIANYRNPFSVIEELAVLLAPAVVEMGIVPSIVPLPERSFLEMTWKTPIVRAMSNHGVLLFDEESMNG